MTRFSSILGVARKPTVLLGIGLALVVVLAWLFAFFEPQTHKLGSLESQKTSLQQAVLADQARLQKVRNESLHVGQIQAEDTKLKGYVPASEDLYTYIQTISSAGNKAGITINSLQPSTVVPATGTTYMAIPIVANIKGTYDQLIAFLSAIYKLPRLTDINGLTISGGGPGTNRSTPLSATLNLVIFTSQKTGYTS